MATEKRLICLDEALEATHKEVFWTGSEQAAVRSFLVKLPRVDAVEVVHGHWIPIPEYENKRCSVCRKVFSDFTLGYYCPNCGAKMDGDGNG